MTAAQMLAYEPTPGVVALATLAVLVLLWAGATVVQIWGDRS